MQKNRYQKFRKTPGHIDQVFRYCETKRLQDFFHRTTLYWLHKVSQPTDGQRQL